MRRVEDRHRVGLGEAGQEVEIRGLPEGVVAVEIAERLLAADDDGEAVADFLEEPLAAEFKCRCVVSHGRSVPVAALLLREGPGAPARQMGRH